MSSLRRSIGVKDRLMIGCTSNNLLVTTNKSNKVAAAGDVAVEERDVERPPPPSTTTEATAAAVEVEVAAETQPPSPPQIESGESSRTHHLTPTVMIRPPPGSSSPSLLSDDDTPPPRPPTASYGSWANTKGSGKGEGKKSMVVDKTTSRLTRQKTRKPQLLSTWASHRNRWMLSVNMVMLSPYVPAQSLCITYIAVTSNKYSIIKM